MGETLTGAAMRAPLSFAVKAVCSSLETLLNQTDRYPNQNYREKMRGYGIMGRLCEKGLAVRIIFLPTRRHA